MSFTELPRTNEGIRICQVIKVKPETLDEYKRVGVVEVTSQSCTLSCRFMLSRFGPV